MVLEIAQIGNPILRTVADEVPLEELKSNSTQAFIDDLIETMRATNGAGLAATQVSVPWRIFVVEVENNPRYPYKPRIPLTVVINPKITFLTEEGFQNYEGCLSIPALRGVVERSLKIRLECYNRMGARVDNIIKGLTAATFQHENDHLDGILFPDRVEDTKTLCTWGEFKEHYEEAFRKRVERIKEEYGS